MSSDAAFVNSELRKLAAEVGAQIQGCQSRGELSRMAHLSAARESILAAVHAKQADERQLSLDDASQHTSKGT